jgi:putative DNA primase/helicase
MKNHKLKSALQAADYGYQVLPVNWATDGLCSCGNPDCSSIGKHPLTSHGVHDATTDKATIRDWFRKYPEANIGVATGKISNLIVIDIDTRHRGRESLLQFESENGRLPDGPAVRTGGGGFHHYFRFSSDTVGNKVGLLPGIDVRSDGGYVVYPGSIHSSGRKYRWLHGRSPRTIRTVPFPASLLKLAKARTSSTPLEPELRIPKGARNATLTSLAGSMRGRGMTEQAIEAALLEENHQRCDPPLSDAEVTGIARSIARYPRGDRGILSASYTEEVPAERKNLKFRTGKQIATEAPAVVPWIVPPFVALGAMTEIDGKPKVAGKTTVVTYMARSVLEGLPFLDEPTKKTKVIYLTEQPLVSFRAAMERARLLGREDFTVLVWTDTFGTPWRSVAEAAIEECKRRGAELLIVDTLAQFAGLIGDTENNAGDALKALRPLQKAAAEGIAVVIVRHERKSGGALGESGRGSSAFAGAVDIIVSIRRPEGNQPRNVRLLQAVSRFDNPDDLLIELTDDGYRPLGTPGEAAKTQAAGHLLSGIPKSKKHAVTIEDLVATSGKSRGQLQKILDALAKTGGIVRSGKGCKGSPYRYFKS